MFLYFCNKLIIYFLKHKILNINILIGIILTIKLCFVLFCFQNFYLLKTNSFIEKNKFYCVIDNSELITASKAVNLPDIKVESTQFDFINYSKSTLLNSINKESFFKSKFSNLPNKLFHFNHQFSLYSFLSLRKLLI